MWRALAFSLLGVGCQCLVPVDENPQADGSTPVAIRDAGPFCSRAADCGGTLYAISWCKPGLADGGFSCVDGRCVVQCAESAGQTCVQDPGIECLRCPPESACVPPSCGAGFDVTYTVRELVCVGASPLSLGERVRQVKRADGGCGSELFHDGPTGKDLLLATLYPQSGGGLSARSAPLGGTCLATELPTGAARLMLDCPLCQVALGP